MLSDADRLSALRSQERQLESVYREDHPTLVRLRREIDDLEAKLTQNVKANSKVNPNNPAYLILMSRLNVINEDIRADEEQIKSLKENVEHYESYISGSPKIEKEYQKLLRDYQDTHSKYQEIHVEKNEVTPSTDIQSSKNHDQAILEAERKGEQAQHDKDLMPIYVPQPRYPSRAKRKGKTGYAVVEVIVTEAGSVRDVKLLEEWPENYGFGKSALKAANKLKYNPRVINGIAVEVPDVSYKFTFSGFSDGR